MGVIRRRRGHRGSHRHQLRPPFATVTAAFVFLMFSASAFSVSPSRQPGEYTQNAGTKSREIVIVNSVKEGGEEAERASGWEVFGRVVTRRRLSGPGSSPPTCRFKCGRCAPCKPVHVPIQPGLSLPLEYYPEAWRCKCGNKVFMP